MKIYKKNSRMTALSSLALATAICISLSSPASSITPLAELMPRAQSGDSFAQNRIGELYLYGRDVEPNYIEASQWFIKAANNGNPVAANHLATLYYNGYGVPEDMKESFKWMKASAEGGYYLGQYNLAVAYEEGNGTEPDLIQAYVWATLASENASTSPNISPDRTRAIQAFLENVEEKLTKEELKKAMWLVQKKNEEFLASRGTQVLVVPKVGM